MDIEKAYNEYVPAVSRADYAMSLEQARYLWQLCEERKPRRLVDFGTGFSSFILRSWAKANGAEHWGVDTNEDWRSKTMLFLINHDLDYRHIVMWDKALEWKPGEFDLAYFDCSEIIARSWYLRRALDMVAPGGVMVVDDTNHQHYRDVVTEHASYARYRCKWLDMPELIDQFKRYPGRIEVGTESNAMPEGLRPVLFAPLPYAGETAQSLLAVAQRGWDWVQLPQMRADQARDLAVWYLLDHPRYTHIVMLDGDQVHPHNIVDRLLRHLAKNPERQVVAGLSYRRGPPFEPMAYVGGEVLSNLDAGLVRVDTMSTGAIAIAREVFETIQPTWFGYGYDDVWERRYTTDDIHFCRRCKAAGIDVYVDTDTTSPHLYTERVDRRYFERWLAEHQDRIERDGVLVIDKQEV